MGQTQTTTLNKRWLFKIGIFLVGLPALGLWGLYDATIKYPQRGEVDACQKLHVYLEAAEQANLLADVGVEDATTTFNQLSAQRTKLLEQAKSPMRALKNDATFKLAQLDWLSSLKKMWKLTADVIPYRLGGYGLPEVQRRWDVGNGKAMNASGAPVEVRTALRELGEHWETAPNPSPLGAFDLLVQWLITVVGFGGAIWPLLIVLRAKRTKYTWDEESMRLTLPSGENFVPDDIADEGLDKRKWHKFFVGIPLKNGTTHTFDLLRFTPLEDWILEMERARFPELAAENAAEAEAAKAAEAAVAATDTTAAESDRANAE